MNPLPTTKSYNDEARHDPWVRNLSDHALCTAAADLCSRAAFDRRNPEHNWTMGRRASLLREIDRRGLK